MPEIMEPDVGHAVFFQNSRKMGGQKIWFHDIANFIDINVAEVCLPAVSVSEHSGDRCHAAAPDRESDWRDNRILLLRSVHGELSECSVKVFPDQK